MNVAIERRAICRYPPKPPPCATGEGDRVSGGGGACRISKDIKACYMKLF